MTNPSQTTSGGNEPVPVQLTRMEGTINLIAYQFGEVKDDIKDLKGDISGLAARVAATELAQAQTLGLPARVAAVELTQATTSGSSASWRAWLPTILAGIGVLAALGLGVTFGR